MRVDIPSYDVNIRSIDSMLSPAEIASRYPVDEDMAKRIKGYRDSVRAILSGEDRRLLAIVGPCSIHDTEAALDYARRLKALSDKLSDRFFFVMRTYFEKPRTTVGCEMLDPIIPQYIDELISWASIGARTTESQTHRNLASGLSFPVGFKNSTSGELNNAVNAIRSASSPSSFIGIDKQGRSAIYRTAGNDMCHLILRGGDRSPNYYEDEVELARRKLEEASLRQAIIIDCSHGNSRKDFRRQKRVLRNIIDQVVWGDDAIRGFMLESNLEEGNQPIGDHMAYGVSITDACIGWDETERILSSAASILREAAEGRARREL